MTVWADVLQTRTRKFALDVIRLVGRLPAEPAVEPLKRQLVKAATSAADNYRSACRARSHAEFTSRMGTVLDEADEAGNWLNMLYEADLCRSAELVRLRAEAAELTAIFATSTKTANANEARRRKK